MWTIPLGVHLERCWDEMETQKRGMSMNNIMVSTITVYNMKENAYLMGIWNISNKEFWATWSDLDRREDIESWCWKRGGSVSNNGWCCWGNWWWKTAEIVMAGRRWGWVRMASGRWGQWVYEWLKCQIEIKINMYLRLYEIRYMPANV